MSLSLTTSSLLPLAIGWLIWYIGSMKRPVVDLSESVMAVHQNQDYEHHPEGGKGVWAGEEARRIMN